MDVPAALPFDVLFSWLSCEKGLDYKRQRERRPAWEDDFKLQTKTIAFLDASTWRLNLSSFHSVPPRSS
jgi:hypothetical protein